MGQCRYCKKDAGFLKPFHFSCFKQHQAGKNKIRSEVSNFGITGGNVEVLTKQISVIGLTSHVTERKVRDLVVKGWEDAVNDAVRNGIVSDLQESHLLNLQQHFGFSYDELDRNGAFSRLLKCRAIRDLIAGKWPEWAQNASHPFNLQSDERLAWLFYNANYYELRTRVERVKETNETKYREPDGTYRRHGETRHRLEEKQEMAHLDTGTLGVTDRHIYFAGKYNVFRISYGEIVSFQDYYDGIQFQRDVRDAKPQRFGTGDGWFIQYLIEIMRQMNETRTTSSHLLGD